MPAHKQPRQCGRCGLGNDPQERQCVSCGTFLEQRAFRMTHEHIKAVHAITRVKGLDEELYRLRLGSVGVTTCKEMNLIQFRKFMDGMKRLPDAPNMGRAA